MPVGYNLRLAFLDPGQRDELAAFLRESSRLFMPHELANLLGATYEISWAIIAELHSSGACEAWLVIYHRCEPDVIAGKVPFGRGYPPLPWACPLCEQEVESYDELLFDVIARTKAPTFAHEE